MRNLWTSTPVYGIGHSSQLTCSHLFSHIAAHPQDPEASDHIPTPGALPSTPSNIDSPPLPCHPDKLCSSTHGDDASLQRPAAQYLLVEIVNPVSPLCMTQVTYEGFQRLSSRTFSLRPMPPGAANPPGVTGAPLPPCLF